MRGRRALCFFPAPSGFLSAISFLSNVLHLYFNLQLKSYEGKPCLWSAECCCIALFREPLKWLVFDVQTHVSVLRVDQFHISENWFCEIYCYLDNMSALWIKNTSESDPHSYEVNSRANIHWVPPTPFSQGVRFSTYPQGLGMGPVWGYPLTAQRQTRDTSPNTLCVRNISAPKPKPTESHPGPATLESWSCEPVEDACVTDMV